MTTTSSRRPTPRRGVVRTVGVAGASAVALLLLAGPASAHVKVFSPDAVPGRTATLQFRVPSEEAAATTVRVAADLPAGVRVDALPDVTGWSASSAPGPDGGTVVTWTVLDAAAAIAPDDKRWFDVRTAALPQQDALTFSVAQTYSDGSVITWDQPATAAGEPQYPAPVLPLVGTRPGAAPDDPSTSAPTVTTAAVVAGSGTRSTGSGIGGSVATAVAGAVAGGVLVTLGAALRVRRRRRTVHS